MGDAILDYEVQFGGFEQLMPFRVREILLVASPYDAFIFAENDRLTEAIFSEYLDLNLHYAPRVTRVNGAEEALKRIQSEPFDLVITMMRVGSMHIGAFAKAAKEAKPGLPLVLLAYNPINIARLKKEEKARFDRIFLWSGDIRILLAVIKSIEDERNIDADIRAAEVQAIILVENSVRFYSYYLPMLYAELMAQTQQLVSDGVNMSHRMLRQRARPKILLATDYGQAEALYERYKDNMLCLITDNTFERDGEIDHDAGLDLIRKVKGERPDMPALLQTSDEGSESQAESLSAAFLPKNSQELLEGIRRFLKSNCGFGDFIFRTPDGAVVDSASDLRSLLDALATAPEDSIAYHASHNHFSKWLKARTEFELAHHIGPKRIGDFPGIPALRDYLIATLKRFVQMSQKGKVADFSTRFFNSDSPFVRIGGGSFGGKGRGLAFLNSFLGKHEALRRWPGVKVGVPSTTVVTTDFFDAFLELNDLGDFLLGAPEDGEICERFLRSELPPELLGMLESFVRKVDHPLAVRSSSLMEDSQLVPLAGVYETYMLPNNHQDESVRLGQLTSALRLVYASTFLGNARGYMKSVSQSREQEKMAVVIQRLAGSRRGDLFFPCISGVAQSYNYYPIGEMRPEEGLTLAALGLGKTVVEGRKSLRFSPAHPQMLHQFSSTKDILANAQRKYVALDMGKSDFSPGPDSSENLVICDIADAAPDEELSSVASTYDHANDRVYDGIYRKGVRLVTLWDVLKGDRFPLAEILRELLNLGEKAVGCPVEMEFAADLSRNEFNILQMRPMMSFSLSGEVRISEEELACSVCHSPKTLGHGRFPGVRDILFVRPEDFRTSQTSRMARAIGAFNARMRKEAKSFVLIGPGRWGSADHSLGVPVTWNEISEAKLIVETTLPDFLVEPSFGTHFLHNVISLGVGYMSVRPEREEGAIDWDWLKNRPACEDVGDGLCHVRLEEPVDIRVDGQRGLGAVLKPRP